MAVDTKKILIISGFALAVLASAYFIFFPSVKPEKNGNGNGNSNGNDNGDDLHKDYIPEAFPLKKGMYGEKIRKIRAFFGLTPTDLFDAELETFLFKKYNIKIISKAIYDYYNKVSINI